MPFPFDDVSTTRVRHALCLTYPVGPYNHVVLAFITSRVPEDFLESDLLVQGSDQGFPATGLWVTSTVRLSRLMTVALSLVQRELGALPDALMAQMSGKLRRLFELA